MVTRRGVGGGQAACVVSVLPKPWGRRSRTVLGVRVSSKPVIPLLWLYGADAVGKSTVAWEVYEQLTGRGVPTAYVDIDYLGFCQPLIGDSPIDWWS